MPQIFISYNRRSLEAVKTLAEDLEAAGSKVWLDLELTGGQRWWDNILANIRECQVFVFALTPESLRSQACMDELGYALALGKPVLPFLLSGDVNVNLLPRPLNEIQFIDYRRQDKQAAFALIKAIAGLPVPGALPDPLPAPPGVPLSYLSDLRERVGTTQTLTFQEQIALVFELKERAQEERSPDEVRELLLSLRQRPDVLAKVRDEIDTALNGLKKASAAPAPRRKRRAGSEGHPSKPRAAPVTERSTSEAVPLGRLGAEIQRALNCILDHNGSCVLEGDAENYIVVTAPARNSLTGEMRFRDGFFESKERAVKALGWEYHMTAKTMLGAVLTGLTWNMSRTGRDLDQSKTAIKSWSITNARGELAAISAQLTSTLKKIVPDAKTIVVRKS